MLFSEAINRALDECLEDPEVRILGQLVKTDHSALVRGLYAKHPDQFITTPVAENLMNSLAMGLALAGRKPIVIHERFDFAVVGMDALVNHIPIWRKKCGVKLPLVIVAVVGKGGGQGPQQSKDFTHWFEMMDGWTVKVPTSPGLAYEMMKESVESDFPTMYVAHRQFFDSPHIHARPYSERIFLNGLR